MAELQLTRTPGDRRLYALGSVGTLRLKGWSSRSATAEASGVRWEIGRRGLFKAVIEATDAAGAVAATFESRTLRRGGALRWLDRELELQTDSIWKERYALVDGERTLATIEGKGWGRRPVKVTIDDAAAVEPGLLLFAAFVVRALAEDAAGSSGAGVAAGGAAAGG